MSAIAALTISSISVCGMFSQFPKKFERASPQWKQAWSTWNFSQLNVQNGFNSRSNVFFRNPTYRRYRLKITALGNFSPTPIHERHRGSLAATMTATMQVHLSNRGWRETRTHCSEAERWLVGLCSLGLYTFVHGPLHRTWAPAGFFAGVSNRGVWRTEVPQQGPGAAPRWGYGGEAPEADIFSKWCINTSSTKVLDNICSRRNHFSTFPACPCLRAPRYKANCKDKT